MSESSAFISYHRDDRIIGEAINDQLLMLAGYGKGKGEVRCFLDYRDIQRGMSWQKVIDDNIKQTDWLIVVFTGEQSAYCGYEIGTFSHTKQNGTRIVTLYDVNSNTLPVVLKNRQNSFVDDVGNIVQQDKVNLSAQEVNYWYNSEIGKFLFDFCSYNGLYIATHQPSLYSYNIAFAAKNIANAFALARATDVKSETPSQISFELTIKNAEFISEIPDEASILGTAIFFDVLGLSMGLSLAKGQPPTTTWGKLKQLVAQGSGRIVPWMHKVETDVVKATGNFAVSGEDATFLGKNSKIYRTLLDRHKLYVNNDRRFYLMFVETVDRRFVGSPRTSLLLASLILASRWRFIYLENWKSTEQNFDEDTSLESFSIACRQLVYNIDSIDLEAAELGASNQQAMIEAFGQQHRAEVEQFFTNWEAAKINLFDVLPKNASKITMDNKKTIGKVVLDFLESTRRQNADFVKLAIDAYGKAVNANGIN